MTQPRVKIFLGILYAIVMVSVGIGLLGLLPIGGALEDKASFLVLTNASVLAVGLILSCTIINFVIVSLRWRLAAEAFAPPGTSHTISYFSYTALTHLLSQVLPATMCTYTVRNIAMRIHDNMPLIRRAFSTLYGQMYEIMVALVFVISSVLVIWGIVTSSHGIAISVAAALMAMMIVARSGRGLTIFVVGLANSVPILRRIVANIDFNDSSIIEHGIFR